MTGVLLSQTTSATCICIWFPWAQKLPSLPIARTLKSLVETAPDLGSRLSPQPWKHPIKVGQCQGSKKGSGESCPTI
jgi:hypothetical protein